MNHFEVLVEFTGTLPDRRSVDLMNFMATHQWFPSRPQERSDYYNCTTQFSAERFKTFLESEILNAINAVVTVTVTMAASSEKFALQHLKLTDYHTENPITTNHGR
jgi:hypothetical protein